MNALVLSPSRGIEYVTDRPAPRTGPDEALIRVRLAGICATDLELTRGYMNFSGVPGHEFVGTVEHGPEPLLRRRVVGEINCPCGRCDDCRRGLAHHCPHRTVLGIAGRDGAFADLLTLPAANCRVVPDTISDRAAVFAEPLAAAAHVLDAVALERGMPVTVLGSGRLGLLVAHVLVHEAIALRVVGRNPRTLALAARHGIATSAPHAVPDRSQDVVIECTGAAAGLREALRMCRPGGTIVLKSTYTPPEPLDLAPIVVNEVRVVGSRCGDLGAALRLLDERRVAVEELITAVYPLSQGIEALAAAARPEHVKVLLEPAAA